VRRAVSSVNKTAGAAGASTLGRVVPGGAMVFGQDMLAKWQRPLEMSTPEQQRAERLRVSAIRQTSRTRPQ
jgi:hypothetical protein